MMCLAGGKFQVAFLNNIGYLKAYSTFRAAFYRIFARLPCVAAGALAVKELRSVLTALKLRFQVAFSSASPTKAAACGTLAPVLSIGGKHEPS